MTQVTTSRSCPKGGTHVYPRDPSVHYADGTCLKCGAAQPSDERSEMANMYVIRIAANDPEGEDNSAEVFDIWERRGPILAYTEGTLAAILASIRRDLCGVKEEEVAV